MPPAHYVYVDPDPTTLNQGDIFDRTPELLGIIAETHPQHAANAQFKYFMMLTQSCDLVSHVPRSSSKGRFEPSART